MPNSDEINDKDYYLLETDDMVIALENKDAIIKELKELLKECKGLIDVERLSLKGVVTLFDRIDNAIGEKK